MYVWCVQVFLYLYEHINKHKNGFEELGILVNFLDIHLLIYLLLHSCIINLKSNKLRQNCYTKSVCGKVVVGGAVTFK